MIKIWEDIYGNESGSRISKRAGSGPPHTESETLSIISYFWLYTVQCTLNTV